MQNEKKFKTKSGYCHILPDKIVLTRNGIIGGISKVTSSSIALRLLIYGIISMALFCSAYVNFNEGNYGAAFLYSITGIFLVYGIVKSLNNSATPVIQRKQIRDVKFHSAKPGLTRAYFEVLFQNEGGKLKKRLIMLPGSLSNGENETAKALEVMKSENLIS